MINVPRKGENIFKRKDGRWEARYVKGYDMYGRQQYGSIYGKNYLEVKNKRANFLLNYKIYKKEQQEKNVFFYDKIIQWLKYQKLSVKITTYTYYSNVVNKYIIPFLGNILLDLLPEDSIINFVAQLNNNFNLKDSTIREIVTILMQILKFCNKEIKIKLPKIKKKEILTLNYKEKQKLEKYILNNINNYSVGILISLYTGLRIRELCALQWKDINLNNGILSVSKTLTRVCNFDNHLSKTKLIIIDAKTNNSIRQIPISKNLIILLNKIRGNQSESNYVLTSTGNFIDPRNFYNQYKRIMKKCNLEQYNFHALRHTFATTCTEKGLDPKSLSEILGHSDIRITLSLYVHPNMKLKQNFMNTKMNLNF